jgi:hypothetical protein
MSRSTAWPRSQGELAVEAVPGEGTRVTGSVPLR